MYLAESKGLRLFTLCGLYVAQGMERKQMFVLAGLVQVLVVVGVWLIDLRETRSVLGEQ